MEQIDDITECCICAELFKDPRMLPCIHTFCLKCLEETRSKSEKNPGDTLPCPICREHFTIPPDGLSGLRKNFFMERLMELVKISKPLKTRVSCDVCLINNEDAAHDIEVPDASEYCVECREKMCEICSIQHKRQKLSRDHQIVPFGDQLKDELLKTSVATYCNQHNKEELKMYCADCKKVICMMCFAESHQMHKCSDVNKVADAFRDEIGIFQAKVVESSKEGLARKLKLEQKKITFLENLEIAETAIKERANELKHFIDKHAKSLLDELFKVKVSRIKETETKNEEIERYIATVNSFNAYCSEIKSKGTPTDISRSVDDLRSRANELQEVNATQNKQYSSVVRVAFKPSATEDDLKVGNIVYIPEVSVDLIKRLGCSTDVHAVTKLDDKIYVLCRKIVRYIYNDTMICIFEDRNPYKAFKNIMKAEISDCQHVVSSEKLKSLYISDLEKGCIWKLTANECRVTQWLPFVIGPFTLSVSKDGNLLLLRDDMGVSQLEIYESDAKIIQSIALPRDITSPRYIIQDSNGQFIIIHKSDESWGGSWVISKLNSEGQLLRQFKPREKIQKLLTPSNMSLDSKNNRLLVAQKDKLNFSVVMFDLASLEWSQILLSSDELLPSWRISLHYDERKKQLLVGKLQEVAVYQIH